MRFFLILALFALAVFAYANEEEKDFEGQVAEVDGQMAESDEEEHSIVKRAARKPHANFRRAYRALARKHKRANRKANAIRNRQRIHRKKVHARLAAQRRLNKKRALNHKRGALRKSLNKAKALRRAGRG